MLHHGCRLNELGGETAGDGGDIAFSGIFLATVSRIFAADGSRVSDGGGGTLWRVMERLDGNESRAFIWKAQVYYRRVRNR